MSELKLIAFLFCTVFFFLFSNACNDVTCISSACGINMYCDNGTCVCEEGYLATGINRCVPAQCSLLNCGPNETCKWKEFSGVYCACIEGYERDSSHQCVEGRIKFIGNYNVSENCTHTQAIYACTFAATSGNTITELNVYNLYNTGQTLVTTLEGDSITIPSQALGNGNIHGGGNLMGNQLKLNYTYMDQSGNSDRCSATLVK